MVAFEWGMISRMSASGGNEIYRRDGLILLIWHSLAEANDGIMTRTKPSLASGDVVFHKLQ